MKSFVEFIREQGVVAFATGFIFGGAVSDLVKAFINDLVNPLVGLLLGSVQGLKTSTFAFLGATFAWGDLTVTLINFLVLAIVVYALFKLLPIGKLDKRKDK